ncbi:MAG: glucose PTS transporter subunit IIA, partial [Carnobacterium sp.]|uniref:glucose PTS transporter subunit IIA n=1 Tax=Carnobacterium sp. TaxID=48221 RepID=UPI002FCAE2C3
MKDVYNLSIYSPVSGRIIKLSDVDDQVFSKKMMGDGFAIEPMDETIVSPAAGKITFIAPTKHAIGIETNEGLAIVLHLGIDTVDLNGTPFELFVKEGDSVAENSKICSMSLKAIESAGKKTTVITAITNFSEKVKDMTIEYGDTSAGNLAASIELLPDNKKSKRHQAENYQRLAENIIRYVGGEENIDSLIHCITRLRFYLKDESKTNGDAMQDLKGVLGVATAGGQYQVIIGPAVND